MKHLSTAGLPRPPGVADAAIAATTPRDLRAAVPALRAAAADRTLAPAAIASILVEAVRALSRPPHGSDLVARIAARSGYSRELLAASVDALTAPFLDIPRIEAFSRRVRSRPQLIGFVMPGNIPGAGLHELITALVAGSAAMVKTSTSEPIFFHAFADAIARHGNALARRVAVFNWGREQPELTTIMREACDRVVVFGGDETVTDLQPSLDDSTRYGEGFAGFGHRLSGAIVLGNAANEGVSDDETAALARDITLFEQRGCLSPHHIFVEDSADARPRPAADTLGVAERSAELECSVVAGRSAEAERSTEAVASHSAYTVAGKIAAALARLARTLPPPRRLTLEPAAAIRRVRETARWRWLGGQDVRLWESDGLGWTVVYDGAAAFTASPGFRTVYVSPFSGLADLADRLEPVREVCEAFAIAGRPPSNEIRDLLHRFGASYLCAPGALQSPPLEWPHGDGSFLRSLLGDR